MKDKIIKALKKAGIMEVEMYGIPKEIDYLYNNLGKSETIFCSALGFLNGQGGVFVVTDSKMMFLHKISGDLQSIEFDRKNILSIDYKQEYPHTISLSTLIGTVLVEQTRPPFGTDLIKWKNKTSFKKRR